jgi:uncharacterized membrane protein YgaE (UPF0421/DUF939 family)
METIIKLIEEKIKSIQWEVDYHSKKAMDALKDQNNLKEQLEKLKESVNNIGKEQNLLDRENPINRSQQ